MSRWNHVYQNLPPDTRIAVNDLVNALFFEQSGFAGKIDPKSRPDLARQWLKIRDDVLANREKFAQWLSGVRSGLRDFALALPILRSLDTTPAWIRIAQQQEVQKVREKSKQEKHPRITEYIRTCTVDFDQKKQQRWERLGEDGIEWCACFVNWCLQQAGIRGLNSAWAPSWARWGTKLEGPVQGAIVCFKWRWLNSKYDVDHVAFCDEVDGEFRMLGGNQSGWQDGGQVSSVPLSRRDVVAYRWPAGA